VDTHSPRPFIIPVFLPHQGCPHQCVFCNQYAIVGGAPVDSPQPAQVPAIVERWLAFRGPGRGPAQLAFFGGNFLGLTTERVCAYLDAAARCVDAGRIESIRFSTRPDTIDERRLARMAAYPVHTIELGAQSMDDRVLRCCRRGHSAADTASAVQLLRQQGYAVGLQLMIGLPGESALSSAETARTAAALRPDVVRIYPTLVLAGSRLAARYAAGRYRPLDLERAVQRAKALFLHFHQRGIAVGRMGLQASDGLDDHCRVVAGPHHPAFGHLVYAALFLDMARGLLETSVRRSSVTFYVHPGSVSKMRGLKNQNVQRLITEYELRAIRIQERPDLPRDGLQLDGGYAPMTFDQLQPSF
jgi:histone acetyltransferase (RNA polymerase elongator complex component)